MYIEVFYFHPLDIRIYLNKQLKINSNLTIKNNSPQTIKKHIVELL